MILIVIAGLCLASVPLAGGSLRRLGELQFRLAWAAPLALVIQVLVLTIAPRGDKSVHVALHLVSYWLIGFVLWANLRVPGVKLIAAGVAANVLAIVANWGVMPASATAERIAHLNTHGGFQNSAPVAHPVLLWLGDVIPIPGPLPNTLSVGDCLIVAGALVLLHKTCGRRSLLTGPAQAAPVGPATH